LTINTGEQIMPEFLGVSDAAKALREHFGVNVFPRDISVRLYDARLDPNRCPVVAGRRMIPRSYLAEIAFALKNRRR
jgi:hypothetical protein